MKISRISILYVAALLTLASCSKPAPPAITPGVRTLVIEKGSDRMQDRGVPWFSATSYLTETREPGPGGQGLYRWKIDSLTYSLAEMSQNPLMKSMTDMAKSLETRFTVSPEGTVRLQDYAKAVSELQAAVDTMVQHLPEELKESMGSTVRTQMLGLTADTATYTLKLLEQPILIHSAHYPNADTTEKCEELVRFVETAQAPLKALVCTRNELAQHAVHTRSTVDSSGLRKIASEIAPTAEIETMAMQDIGYYKFDEQTKALRTVTLTRLLRIGEFTLTERTKIRIDDR